MINNRVVFLGGNPSQFASVQIRCIDIASALGCDQLFGVREAAEVPDKYEIFVCVKAGLRQREINGLARRGKVIWDIIDHFPPRSGICVYIASTKWVQRKFRSFGRVQLIRHHHCNFSGLPNRGNENGAAWIGNVGWYPDLSRVAHRFYDVRKMTRGDIVGAFRATGIGINLRGQGPKFQQHVRMNSGIKLINCIGFGIPSISSDEPGYREIGEGCTIFSDLNIYAESIQSLEDDGKLYHDLRERCIELAPSFHISSIVGEYRRLLQSL